MTNLSHPPYGKRPVPGLPSPQIWNAASFQTPKYPFFPWQGWRWRGSVSGCLTTLGLVAGLLFVVYAFFVHQP
jgi:hypothetical protein